MTNRLFCFFLMFILTGYKESGINITTPATVLPESSNITATSSSDMTHDDGADNGKIQGENEYKMGFVPQLSSSACSIDSFIPSGWTLLDSAESDFNNDGLTDVVGVIERNDDENIWYPRILFVAWQTADNHYKLGFQDINLIRTRNEGGTFGDPYEPLTVNGNTFTISAYGGSSWKWSEKTTFEHRSGDWYLAQSSTRGGCGPITTSISHYDYHTGIGVIRLNSEDADNLEVLAKDTQERFELEYTVKLNAAPSIYEAGQRWWLASDRLNEIPVKNIRIASSIKLDPSHVIIPAPNNNTWIKNMDESYILYTFQHDDIEYLASYDRKQQVVNVIFESCSTPDPFQMPRVYQGKIYCGENITETMQVKRENKIIESREHIATQIICMNLDGSETEVLFRYNNEYEEGKALEKSLPFIFTNCDPFGEELIVSLYISDSPKRYYRMNLDGTNLQLIGELKGFN